MVTVRIVVTLWTGLGVGAAIVRIGLTIGEVGFGFAFGVVWGVGFSIFLTVGGWTVWIGFSTTIFGPGLGTAASGKILLFRRINKISICYRRKIIIIWFVF
ncbi:hypothetical protein [Mesomycoplasma ovipneumoniae]|uniref:hypothetical protein n=1 Tax=Mesomycoplasma ovipneumoniae TaxID=29562 RepID=UPI00311AC907